ncbi:uncharacterized protein isoform X2 [Leptinotarsa decemlineata]|uniref:uncharacterized protein isoform X2 n=1 Tax=Leptinotarsa decemlineata TaxID=7539 RepID=UPI003D30BC1B
MIFIYSWNYLNLKCSGYRYIMNFPSFGGHFSTTIPTIHQFAAKFSQENSNNPCPAQENSNRYTANGVPSFTQHHHATQQQMLNTINSGKYQGNYLNQAIYTQQNNVRPEKRQIFEPQEFAQELCAAMLQQSQQEKHIERIKPDSQEVDRRNQQSSQNIEQIIQQSHQTAQQNINQTSSAMPPAWQSLATSSSTVADYLSHLPSSTLPLSLHHFLKYSAESIKKEHVQQLTIPSTNDTNSNLSHNSSLNVGGLNVSTSSATVNNLVSSNGVNSLTTINTAQLQNICPAKKKRKKRPEKEKKPRPKPGEIRLTTALDGSTLYCCPECHMAYPEKELLEQHLVGHTLERRFVCDICGAGLKRKDHLTRHKQSHNPERPYVCTVCLKAFKRKEQLTLHFVIHSGEKRHICSECGKGFYRKDHLRKHTRSHIARRVKAELSQQSFHIYSNVFYYGENQSFFIGIFGNFHLLQSA